MKTKYRMGLGKIFLEFLDRRIEGFGGAQYKAFGLFGVINYPFCYYILYFLGADESIIARLSASLLCIPLIFVKYWPSKLKKYLNLYWFFTLLYCLPVFTTYTLLKNQMSTEWLLNFSIGLFILFLIVDYILLLIIYILGIILGYFLFISTGQEVVFQQGFPTSFIYIYLAMLIIGCIFARNKEKLENERLQTMKSLAGAMAHEMRTPLLGIVGFNRLLQRYMPTLIEVYKKSDPPLYNGPAIPLKNLDDLSKIPDSLEKITHQARSIIDMLLINLKEDVSESSLEVCSINDCVEDALNEYPLTDEDGALISFDKTLDFHFFGNPLFVKHVIFNLLKNALYYVKAVGKGSIFIWCEIDKDVNKLHFKDTGMGIAKEVLPYIFDRFFTKTKYGTGIGLAFCRIVMRKLGGDIVCLSKKGDFTHFILTFPVVK